MRSPLPRSFVLILLSAGAAAGCGLSSSDGDAEGPVPPPQVSICSLRFNERALAGVLVTVETVLLPEDAVNSDAYTEPGCPFGILAVGNLGSPAARRALETAFRRSTQERWFGLKVRMRGRLTEMRGHGGMMPVLAPSEVLSYQLVPAGAERARFYASIPKAE